MEIIKPIKIAGKEKGTGKPSTKRPTWVKTLVLVFVFVLMVVGGALLLQYLAQNPVNVAKGVDSRVDPTPRAKEKSVATTKDQPAETAYPTNRSAAREEAEQKLASFTLIRNELEKRGASEWGDELYDEMIQLSKSADAFLIKKDYISASKNYTAAIAKANTLTGQIDPALERLLKEGRMALEEGDGERAQRKFIVALMIDPANDSAQHNLERAKKIGVVMQLIKSGKGYEKKGALSFAHADYQEALRLDPESKEARKSLNRVDGQIKDEEFQQLMSEGLEALHHNDYPFARDKLLKAKSFRPESQEVSNALAQIDQAIRLIRIEELRKDAVEAENSENWARALKSYLAVLEIDGNVRFAAQGKERSLKQIRIEKRINFFLQKSDVLESGSQLENAVLLVHEVQDIEPKGPRLTAQFKELAQLVKAAQIPVRITIESDTLTDVTVYKLGRLGRFSIRELSLRPGTYTVVGARDGYKDVRRKIVIKPGQEPLRIAIECTVKI